MGVLRIFRRSQAKQGKAHRFVHYATWKSVLTFPTKAVKNSELTKQGLFRIVEWKV